MEPQCGIIVVRNWPADNVIHIIITSLAAPGALSHRLQRRTACNAAQPASGPQNGGRGLERGPILGYWALPSTFAK